MAKKRIKLTKPDVRTIYLGSGHKQKARYIQLPRDFGMNLLKNDIAAGATIYRPFLSEFDLEAARYNVVTCNRAEDGYRAIAYIEGVYAERGGYKSDNVSSDRYQEIKYSKSEDDNEYLEDHADGEIFYDVLRDEFNGYEERWDNIPLIDIEEVQAEEHKSKPAFSFGPFNMDFAEASQKVVPWWSDCECGPICIVKDLGCTPFGAWDEVALTEDDIDCIKRFDNNCRVYLLLVGNIPAEDHSVARMILEYTANRFRVDADESDSYYRELFKAVAGEHGFSLSSGLDVGMIAEKLRDVDRNRPCNTFDKVMRYLEHIGAGKTLKASYFSGFGLGKLISRIGDAQDQESLEDQLVGLDDIKKKVNRIIDVMKYDRLRVRRGLKSSGFHNVHVFIGAPGTAKTTVAKYMAKAMQEEGLLNGNRFISVTGAQLKGEYVGQTAPKVHALFHNHDAVFIDEAYSLTCGTGEEGGMDSYSQEALAQLAVELEEHAKDKLIIFAGYGGKKVSDKNNLMTKFMEANPGIRSRINTTIFFDSYEPETMVKIIHHLAQKASLNLPEELDKYIADYYLERRGAANFGNGREARVFVEHCEACIAERVAAMDPETVTKYDLTTVTEEDIIRVIEEFEGSRVDENSRTGITMGFA